jgi:hypothetical protein
VAVVRLDPSSGSVDRAEEGFDVIGDVHGCHAQLIELLHALGYRNDTGVYRHPTRRAIFVGDLIDRGPAQVAVLKTVRAMDDAGTAIVVMGNHEFNAVCWATNGPDGTPLRAHSPKNLHQHDEFLQQIGEGSDDHKETIAWFRQLPLWLEIDGLRVVHACWDPAAINGLDSPTLDPRGFVEASDSESEMFQWVEHLCKGPEIELPTGHSYTDKDGHERKRARYRWWDPGDPITYRSACVTPPKIVLPDHAIPSIPVEPYADETPVLFGHYWHTWAVDSHTDKTGCIDYSAVKGGTLAAYRWSGEDELSRRNLIGVSR